MMQYHPLPAELECSYSAGIEHESPSERQKIGGDSDDDDDDVSLLSSSSSEMEPSEENISMMR